MDFYTFIKSVQDLGTKDKTEALKAYKDNMDFKQIFKFMLDPTYLYYIKEIPFIATNATGDDILSDDHFVRVFKVFNDLSFRGHALDRAVGNFAGRCDTQHRIVLEWILDGKNPAKIGTSIVNEVWPGLIYKQVYMGAVPGDDKALARLNWKLGINVQKKEDGMTFLVQYTDGIPVTLRTRAGQDITKYFPGFMSRQNNAPSNFNSIVHHEALIWDTEDNCLLERKVGNGLINKHVKNGRIGGGVDGSIHSIILDYYGDETQAERYFNMYRFENETTRRVEQQLVFSIEEAKEIAQMYISGGGEGVICKDPRQPFRDGKPWFCVKLKNEFTVELRAVEWKEHSKRPGEIGSVLCQSEDGSLEVWVNAKCDEDRLLDFDRYWYWHVFQVKAESIIKSKTKKKPSLYLPRFDGDNYYQYVRNDKPMADTYKEIKQKEKESKEMNHDTI